MKRVTIKRLVYVGPQGETHFGAEEFDAHLSDDNILGLIHAIGKTVWIGENLWLLCNGAPTYRISVERFYQYTKSRFDLLLDAIRRI